MDTVIPGFLYKECQLVLGVEAQRLLQVVQALFGPADSCLRIHTFTETRLVRREQPRATTGQKPIVQTLDSRDLDGHHILSIL